MIDDKPFAEVIESSLKGWVAQSWQWDFIPEFGSIVSIEAKEKTLFGLVYKSSMGSLEESRHVFAYKKTLPELRAEQPHIFEFIQTTFACVLIGFLEDSSYFYRLAPTPALLHAFVQPISHDNLKEICKTDQFLHLIFSLQNECNVDELLLALIAFFKKRGVVSSSFYEKFYETFSVLIGNDYRRLKIFLQRL